MEKAKIRIEKRGTEEYGYIFLAFLTVFIPNRYPYISEHLVMIADRPSQMEVRLEPWKRRFDLEIEEVKDDKCKQTK